MMKSINTHSIEAFRKQTFRSLPGLRLRSADEAVTYVNERGFVYFWPIKDVLFPSLWTAVAGDRPVAAEHDDPGHVTWGWKDQMLDQRRWFYAKVLRGRATMIALDVVPYFYALSKNYGDPDRDYLDQYRDGQLSQPAKVIYETLLYQGPMDTVNLRKTIRMTSKASNSPFERGLVELQRDFKILPVGVANTGAWRYSFTYDLVHRYDPEIPEAARWITEGAARQRLIGLFFAAVGAATLQDVRRLFQWKTGEIQTALRGLVEKGDIKSGYRVGQDRTEIFLHQDVEP